MTDRSAVDTIRGYFYQFDLSILSVLRLASLDDSVEIECIEDIDIRTATDVTATQCKYYAKTEYNHSVIKDAVKHMVSHFKESLAGTKPKVLYSIKGHYASGQEKLDDGIDVEFLKKHFLTYTKEKVTYCHHIELGLSDAELEEFLKRLSIDVRAKEFDEQFREVVETLQAIFGGSSFSAEYFFYNNALAVIREMSVNAAPADRSITKREFLARVNTSSVLFNEWFVEKKGKKAHLAALRKEYFTELNVSPFERFFLVEVETDSYIRGDLKDLFLELSKKWAKLSAREPSPFCPYIYVHGVPDSELLALKRELSAEGFKLIDGHDFQGADFSCHSIMQRATHGNGIKIKILNTLSNVEQTISSVTKTRRIYQFHLGNCYFEYDNPAVRHVKIQVERLSDVKSII
ncbi:TPA: hypothetical protein L4Q87_000402 [Pseudomonas aeruginosa]|jgi:hypothetical protein|uniref:Uncharacterized protein n=1 Tax=Stutzerimonas chloritidismutans TaxID=203192 RepID=A0ACC5VPN6_STUCH|nr:MULTISPECIES: DUF4297 family anti-phage-associated protein [Pseudomonadaceae]KSL68409.1 hypothetical protein APA58_19710 [Pseudomonas aeruginosa]KSM81280.1 hypothetical protein APA73_20335 [Pseudomonas aeruginosa]MBG6886561.1 hypothetical protein [Pseudomonas aeruginosa]MBV5861122.1 hypothetical protein [Pseudomonas aeruginosa]MBX7274321.1 hypothetical protein [Stutzerimonas chloritidismutans]